MKIFTLQSANFSPAVAVMEQASLPLLHPASKTFPFVLSIPYKTKAKAAQISSTIK
jgi:hypothetical protein